MAKYYDPFHGKSLFQDDTDIGFDLNFRYVPGIFKILLIFIVFILLARFMNDINYIGESFDSYSWFQNLLNSIGDFHWSSDFVSWTVNNFSRIDKWQKFTDYNTAWPFSDGYDFGDLIKTILSGLKYVFNVLKYIAGVLVKALNIIVTCVAFFLNALNTVVMLIAWVLAL